MTLSCQVSHASLNLGFPSKDWNEGIRNAGKIKFLGYLEILLMASLEKRLTNFSDT